VSQSDTRGCRADGQSTIFAVPSRHVDAGRDQGRVSTRNRVIAAVVAGSPTHSRLAHIGLGPPTAEPGSQNRPFIEVEVEDKISDRKPQFRSRIRSAHSLETAE
jgi:hypothetical protein